MKTRNNSSSLKNSISDNIVAKLQGRRLKTEKKHVCWLSAILVSRVKLMCKINVYVSFGNRPGSATFLAHIQQVSWFSVMPLRNSLKEKFLRKIIFKKHFKRYFS